MSTVTRRTISFVAIVLGFFMALLDSTIVNIALPEMIKHFGGSVGQISWVMNGYNLAFAVFILTAARLADQFGRKKVFLIGVLLFTVTSLLAGFAPSAQVLIGLRVLQGLAGAIIVPVTVPMATEIFPKEMHGTVVGIWGGISGLAAASGPALGGILTEKLNWQWIFFVNIPLGIISILLTMFFIKESYDSTSSKRIDYAGTISISGAMFCLTYALIKANEYGWGSYEIMGLIAGGCLLLLLFFVVEAKGKHPMLPLSLLKIRVFDGAALTLFMVGAGIMNITFLSSFYLTRVMEMTELKAGLLISVLAVGSMVASMIVGPLSSKYGSRWFAVIGVVILCISTYWLSGLGIDSTKIDVVIRLALAGVGVGLTMAPLMGSIVRNVPEEKVGISSGAVNMMRALGSVLGVAIIVTILQSNMTGEMDKARGAALELVQSNAALSVEVKEQLKTGLMHTSVSSTGSAQISADEIVNTMKEQGKVAAEQLTEQQRPVFVAALEQQAEEVKQLLLRIQHSYLEAASNAFNGTFVFSSVLMLLGIPFAWFSDYRRKERAGIESLNYKTES
ncbi:MFS transporter [Paenibacillus segetis]|uniref:MFS transporter n=1 Tax=Paenibacillus segetis TaxID=1325360 RepID=A0ABQ1YMH9_9BACL|nr:MFS transporter [Paenibacillus segetis]GGH30082.1 MFS transporter [Paenibacillus segetis]